MEASKLRTKEVKCSSKEKNRRLIANSSDLKKKKKSKLIMKTKIYWFASGAMDLKSTKKDFLAENVMDQENLRANSSKVF